MQLRRHIDGYIKRRRVRKKGIFRWLGLQAVRHTDENRETNIGRYKAMGKNNEYIWRKRPVWIDA